MTAELELMWSPLQREIINTLEKNGPMTRADLVKHVDKPRTTVYDNLLGLIRHDIVMKYSQPLDHRGRPLVFFSINTRRT